ATIGLEARSFIKCPSFITRQRRTSVSGGGVP
ncbi:hypothetical protein NPIL_675831, partial [Nephila pilipes]